MQKLLSSKYTLRCTLLWYKYARRQYRRGQALGYSDERLVYIQGLVDQVWLIACWILPYKEYRTDGPSWNKRSEKGLYF